MKIQITEFPNKHIYSAVHNNKIYGQGVVNLAIDIKQAWITALKIEKEYQGQGIGTEILNAIKHKGYNKPIAVRACPYEDSDITQSALEFFYIKNGFRPIDGMKGYLVYKQKRGA